MVDYHYAGVVTHYFNHIAVAVIQLEAELYLEDWVLFEGPHTSFEQQVTSMQINYTPIEQALPGDEVAVKVEQPVHEGDRLYLIVAG